MENFEIKIANSESYSIISIVGQADMLVVDRLDKAFNDLINTKSSKIIVDLNDLSFICSIAISSLIRAHRECKKCNGELVLAGMSDVIMRLLQTTQLDSFFTLYSTVENAADDFSAK